MKIIVTTSEKYYHLLPVFAYLFQKYWSKEQPVEIVGYSIPKWELPENWTFHSMGVQGPVSEWSTDLRRYFTSLHGDQWFIWLMEDCFIKKVGHDRIKELEKLIMPEVGRIDLTNDLTNRRCYPYLTSTAEGVFTASRQAPYRQSTQPSIWNKEFLLKYLTDGLDPWQFEKQDTSDNFTILGGHSRAVYANEGVRKHNPHELDLNGFSQEDIDHIKSLL